MTVEHLRDRDVGAPRLLSVVFVLGAFALGTSENLIAGLIPQLSQELRVPLSQVGLLVTAYAGTAVIAGPVIALLTARMRLRSLTLSAMILYAAGTMLAVFAPSYAALMLARIVTGAMHTPVLVAFMLTALRMAPPGERGRTVGRITLGLGVATVIGVPVGNTLSEVLGWQWAFALVAALIVLTLLLALVVLPDDRERPGEAGWRSLRVLTQGPVLGGIGMTAMAGLGAMTLLAFAVPFLTATGIEDGAVAPLLLIYGAACLGGNVVGGRLADRGLRRSLIVTLSGTGFALVIAGTVGNSPVGGLVGLSLVGITYFATFPPLNTWIATSADGIAPGLALAVNSSAFNIGIAVAGGVGGAVLSAGLEATTLPYLGAGALVIGASISIMLRAPSSPLPPRLDRVTRP